MYISMHSLIKQEQVSSAVNQYIYSACSSFMALSSSSEALRFFDPNTLGCLAEAMTGMVCSLPPGPWARDGEHISWPVGCFDICNL